MFQYSQKSLDKLNNPKLHPKLKQLFLEAIKNSPVDFTIVETVRTLELQKKYVKDGKSKTLKSRHIPETNKSKLCEAVDIAPIVNNKTDYTKCEGVSNSQRKQMIGNGWTVDVIANILKGINNE